MKVTPTKIITTSSENINSVPNKKYRLSPNEIEKKSLSSERFRTLFNFHRVSEQKNYTTCMIGTIRKNMEQKEKKLRENLDIDKKILVLTKRIRKKSAPGKFYK